jgi:RNA polymerase sigma-70 factor (ECF subfamily)
VERNEETNRLYQMLDELPDVYRSVITLVDVHELDYAEAATALKIPIGTLKSRLVRARLKMKEKLKRANHHPSHRFAAKAYATPADVDLEGAPC